MTHPSEVTISDAEVDRFNATRFTRSTHAALRELIAERVPKPMKEGNNKGAIWFNACRDAVLKGGV